MGVRAFVFYLRAGLGEPPAFGWRRAIRGSLRSYLMRSRTARTMVRAVQPAHFGTHFVRRYYPSRGRTMVRLKAAVLTSN
jgi:hypothetical protein